MIVVQMMLVMGRGLSRARAVKFIPSWATMGTEIGRDLLMFKY